MTPQSRRVLLDHDGGVDDLLSLAMVLAMPHLQLAGVVVTPADCYLGPAVSATRKSSARPRLELMSIMRRSLPQP